MDEQHWLLNTTFAGFVLVVAFFSWVLAFTGQSFGSTIQVLTDKFFQGMTEVKELGGLAQLLAVGGLLPLLGMVVKVFSIIGWSPWHFNDVARELVGEASRNKLLGVKKQLEAEEQAEAEERSETSGPSDGIPNRIKTKLQHAPLDPLYNWFSLKRRHEDKLLDWTRNRGHYMFMAENALTATLLALIPSLAYCGLACGPACFSWKTRVVVFVCLGVWCSFLGLLRVYMKRSADVMHLAWVLERIDWRTRFDVLSPDNLKTVVTDKAPQKGKQ